MVGFKKVKHPSSEDLQSHKVTESNLSRWQGAHAGNTHGSGKKAQRRPARKSAIHPKVNFWNQESKETE